MRISFKTFFISFSVFIAASLFSQAAKAEYYMVYPSSAVVPVCDSCTQFQTYPVYEYETCGSCYRPCGGGCGRLVAATTDPTHKDAQTSEISQPRKAIEILPDRETMNSAHTPL